MSAQSLRNKVVKLFEVCGTAKIINVMSQNQVQLLIKQGVPEDLAQRITDKTKARLGDRFLNRISGMLIEAGMDEESADAAIAFYTGAGAKFLAICQSPQWLEQLQKVCIEEMEAATEIVRKEMELGR